MTRKVLTFIILFYVVILLTTSFLVHFKLGNLFSGLFLVFFTLASFLYFWKQKKYRKKWQRTCYEFSAVFVIGFFWDIFSDSFLGFHVLILFVLVVFTRFVFKNYIQL